MKHILLSSLGLLMACAAMAQAQVARNIAGPTKAGPPIVAPTVANHAGAPTYFDQVPSDVGGCDAGCSDCCAPCLDCCKYIKLFGGWTGLEDFDTFNQQFTVNGTFNDGFGVGLAWGRKLRPMLNIECEFTYRHNQAAEITASPPTAPPIVADFDGEVNSYSGMTNFMFEGCRRVGRCTPYGGAGAGFGFVTADASTQFGDYTIDDSGFAYQFIAGASHAIGCRADVFAEYRYFSIEDNQVQNQTGATIDDFDYRTHNVFFGLRMCH
jgi:opacity protein-like surface antigen